MSAQETLDAAEAALDDVEVGSWLFDLLRDHRLHLVVAAVAGGAVGYFAATKRLKVKYDEQMNQEIEEARDFYRNMNKLGPDDRPLSPEEVLFERHGEVPENVKEAIVSYSPTQPVELEQPPVETKHNIFTDAEVVPTTEGLEGWDYQTELRIREENPGLPYIISEEEYLSNESELEQVALTYYAGDGVVVDEHDMPVQDSDALVGDDNLTRFGHGTSDETALYIRNDNMEVEYELALDEGKYSVKVLGIDDTESELRHSHRPRSRRKFRKDDDEE